MAVQLLKEGDAVAVEAGQTGKAQWFPGKIQAANADSTYDLNYDDGDNKVNEAKVPRNRIRPAYHINEEKCHPKATSADNTRQHIDNPSYTHGEELTLDGAYTTYESPDLEITEYEPIDTKLKLLDVFGKSDADQKKEIQEIFSRDNQNMDPRMLDHLYNYGSDHPVNELHASEIFGSSCKIYSLNSFESNAGAKHKVNQVFSKQDRPDKRFALQLKLIQKMLSHDGPVVICLQELGVVCPKSLLLGNEKNPNILFDVLVDQPLFKYKPVYGLALL